MWYENTESTDAISSFPKGSYDTGSIYHVYLLASAEAFGHFNCQNFASLLKQKIKLRDCLPSTLTPLLHRPVSTDLRILFYSENKSKTAISWFKPK